MIALKGVHAGYKDNTVLTDLSLSLEKGVLTSIVGPNGCGKSTLIKTVLGILPVKSGDIFIDGQNQKDMPRGEIAKKISYLAQGKSAPDMTVEQMVLHGRFPHLNYPRRYSQADREIALAAMEKVGIKAFADRPMYALSGGMRQNAYIAMALAQDTDYILLDEPTTYLDIAHQIELMRLLCKLCALGKGIITVMHDLPLAFTFSHRILLLGGGGITEDGSPEEVSTSESIRRVFGVSLARSRDEKTYVLHYDE